METQSTIPPWIKNGGEEAAYSNFAGLFDSCGGADKCRDTHRITLTTRKSLSLRSQHSRFMTERFDTCFFYPIASAVENEIAEGKLYDTHKTRIYLKRDGVDIFMERVPAGNRYRRGQIENACGLG